MNGSSPTTGSHQDQHQPTGLDHREDVDEDEEEEDYYIERIGFWDQAISGGYPSSIIFPEEYTRYTMPMNGDPPRNVYEPRGTYSHRSFSREVDAYQQLEKHKCPHVPKYFGCYKVLFPDRGDKIDYDKAVNVIMLERIKGPKLSDLLKNDKIDAQPVEYVDAMVDRLYESIDSIHASGVYHGLVFPDNCIIKKGKRPIGKAVWTDFTYSILMDGGIDSERKSELKDSDVGRITTLMIPVYDRREGLGILVRKWE